MGYDLIVLGNSIVDYVSYVSKVFLKNLNLKEGSSKHISCYERDMLKCTKNSYERYSGGSGANTAAAFANLGGKVAYFGAVGDDENGRFFKKDMRKAGIKRTRKGITTKPGPTGTAIAFVTDNERTMRYDNEFSPILNRNDLHIFPEKLFRNSEMFHFTGYAWESMPLAVDKALKLADWYGLQISFDVGSDQLINNRNNRRSIDEMINNNISIVFANESEAKALTGYPPEKAVSELANLVDIAVVKMGKDGSLIKSSNGEEHRIQPVPARVVNVTGAGDSYAGAFLYFYNKQKFSSKVKKIDLKRCGQKASEYSSLVVSTDISRLDFRPRIK